ncbi:IclR family transcriptional regulator [Pseudoroseomonas globiformis]|uniref:IclR family transcriptional regulator n=1 Tax=Teichococcus globiformis TaxID=2307229 RepID=A0ABV7G4Z6_9PROT
MEAIVLDPGGSLRRAFGLLRLLGEGGAAGLRLTELAQAAALPPATVHRLMRLMMTERLVTFDPASKHYRLGLELFLLAAQASNPLGLRDLARPGLLRLTAELNETLFLLVHNGYDAVCIDRSSGPWPIRSFTGDIGGRVPLGMGQGSVAILAFLPDAEQDEIIRHNTPRLRQLAPFSEGWLRRELLRVRSEQVSGGLYPVNPGMAGLAVPIRDGTGRAVAALSIGTTAERLDAERRAGAREALMREAALVEAGLNPFDPSLHRAAAAMEPVSR